MWVVATYEATALFSLKPASATASGGRTLLVPTPYAIKMALLDVACRVDGVGMAESVCDWLSPASVGIVPPERIVVNNTFIRVLKPYEFKGKKIEKDEALQKARAEKNYPFRTPYITYREYAQLDGTFKIALSVEDSEHADLLRYWLMCINYLGKRGSFIQVQSVPLLHDSLDDEFIVVGEPRGDFDMNAIMTQLDDTSESLTFEQANIYSGKRITLGKDRLLHHVALPYQRVRSSRGYSYYQRIR